MTVGDLYNNSQILTNYYDFRSKIKEVNDGKEVNSKLEEVIKLEGKLLNKIQEGSNTES
ncbi:MAG TPA: hypothetical protein VF842_00290 [Flavobacterium sp.]